MTTDFQCRQKVGTLILNFMVKKNLIPVLFCSGIIAFILQSCVSNVDQIAEQTSNDSLRRIDSLANIKKQYHGIFKDERDGKVYKTIKIGTQIWMAENLAYQTSSGCWAYAGDPSNVPNFGYLYDWETAKKICPDGWHLPSYKDWRTLYENIGGERFAGTKMKGNSGWKDSGNGTNESGFDGLPGGARASDEEFFDIGSSGWWWTSTEGDTYDAIACVLYFDDESVGTSSGLTTGSALSVRCIKD